jgi:hypothetical protein
MKKIYVFALVFLLVFVFYWLPIKNEREEISAAKEDFLDLLQEEEIHPNYFMGPYIVYEDNKKSYLWRCKLDSNLIVGIYPRFIQIFGYDYYMVGGDSTVWSKIVYTKYHDIAP